MPLPTAIAQFLREFEAFDGRCVNAALASLTPDAALLEQAQLRLELHARLTLIKRLAMVCADNASLALLDRVIERSAGLRQKYEELTRNGFGHARDTGKVSSSPPKSERREPPRVWLPTMIEIYDSIGETGNLQRMLQAVVDRYRAGAAATMSPVAGDNRVHNSMFSPAPS
jgi:hypothetical protein